MFRNWGFLLTEMWVLIALAALLGLLVGWLIWWRGSAPLNASGNDTARLDHDKQITALRAAAAEKDREITRLNAAVATRNSEITALTNDLKDCRASQVASPAPAAEPVAAAPAMAAGLLDQPTAAMRPEGLKGPRGGTADDLKRIKGVGPKMEQLCNKLGFYHFDQIASWTAAEVAWVDENLEGFTGRVTRDNWIDQAKLLATGGETAFSKKVDKGGVY